jgi:hypothetical protein
LIDPARRNEPGAYRRLLDRYEQFDDYFAPRGPARRPRRLERITPPDARLEALARLLAERARRDRRVQTFRRSVLGGTPMAWGELEAWVQGHRPSTGEPLLAYFRQRTPMDLDQARRMLAAGRERRCARPTALAENALAKGLRSEQGWERAELRYVREDGHTGQTAVPMTGELFELYRLVMYLTSDAFSPQTFSEAGPAWAATWALCDVTPYLPMITVSVSRASLPALDRISIRANWRASAEEVKREYNLARGPEPGRDKPMGDKNLALGILADRWRHEESSWPARRQEWNALCDDKRQPKAWRFEVESDPRATTFANHARGAWRRLTGDKWGGSR